MVAEDTPEGLKRLVAEQHGQPPTLESVFMTFTGRSLDEDVEEDGDRRLTDNAPSIHRQPSQHRTTTRKEVRR